MAPPLVHVAVTGQLPGVVFSPMCHDHVATPESSACVAPSPCAFEGPLFSITARLHFAPATVCTVALPSSPGDTAAMETNLTVSRPEEGFAEGEDEVRGVGEGFCEGEAVVPGVGEARRDGLSFAIPNGVNAGVIAAD